MTLLITDENRVRTLTLDRPDALNAFNESLYDATADALSAAAEDPEVAVVVITGAGRAFSAGQDLAEMQARITDPGFTPGTHGFPGLIAEDRSHSLRAIHSRDDIRLIIGKLNRTGSAAFGLGERLGVDGDLWW